jgi:hypothetical protein
MQKLENTFSSVETALLRINDRVRNVLPDITVYRNVTIPIRFENVPQCFDHLISWSYSLIFESLNKHYDFLSKQAQKLNAGITSEIIEFKQVIHYLRTFAQHSQFDPDRLAEFSDYNCFWFQKVCGQNQPTTDEEWLTCIEKILYTLIEVIACFEQTITEAINGEFGSIFLQEWQKVALRTYSKFDYESVLVVVLADTGLSNKIDPQLFTKKYLTDWQRGLDILPEGFDFAKEVYPIIQRSIAKEDVIPVNGPELMKAGVPSGPMLGKCIAEAKRSFYANPCNPEELIDRIVNWYRMQTA